MTIVTLACVLTGMAVGLRFKVLMIMPVIVIAVLFTVAMTVARGNQAWMIVSVVLLNAIGVQVGYLCGTFAHSILRDSRTPDHALAPSARASTAYKAQVGMSAPAQYLD